MSYSLDFMYEVICNKDPEYNGIFYTCVKTTRIFCIPSCKAKTPLKKNLEFVNSSEEALEKGYRPCKRCHPLNTPNFYPEWLNHVEKYLNDHIDRKVTDIEISEFANLDISTIRRYFKQRFSTSIKEYHRLIRMNKAKQLKEEGLKTHQIASLIGYNSVKGFKIAYNKQFGDSTFETT